MSPTEPRHAAVAAKPSPKQRLAVAAALIALTVLAFLVRLRGIDHGLPMAVEQDCKIPYQVELLRQGGDAWKTDREFRWYPLFLADCAQLLPQVAPAPAGATLEEHLAVAAAPQIQVRLIVALFAALMAPATYLLAALFLERRWALIASLFSVFSLLSISFSQQSRPHAAAGALFTWSLLALVRMRRKGDALGRGLAGGAIAASIGCLQSGLALLPALVVAALARRTHRRRWLDPRWIVLIAPIALGVLFFYPYEWAAGPLSPQSGSEATPIAQGGHLLFLKEFRFGGALAMARSLWSYEPMLTVLALLGVVLWALDKRKRISDPVSAAQSFTRRRDLWVVLAFALPYAAVLAAYNRTYERFLIPLLPELACCAAFALRAALRRASRDGVFASMLVGAMALAPNAWLCWRLGTIRSAPHTTELAAQWIVEHRDRVRPLDIVLTPQLDLPLAREPEGFANWMPGGIEKQATWVWSRYQASLPDGHAPLELWKLRWWRPKLMQMVSDPATYVAQQGGDLLVAEVFAENRASPAGTVLRDWLLEHASREVVISPDSEPGYSLHPLGYQEETSVDPGIFFLRVAQARATGPVIEIYMLPRR